MTNSMQPTTIKVVRLERGEWFVVQKFVRLGTYEVTIIGYGYDRHRALQDFENQKKDIELESAIPMGPMDHIAGFLWDVAGVIDWYLT